MILWGLHCKRREKRDVLSVDKTQMPLQGPRSLTTHLPPPCPLLPSPGVTVFQLYWTPQSALLPAGPLLRFFSMPGFLFFPLHLRNSYSGKGPTQMPPPSQKPPLTDPHSRHLSLLLSQSQCFRQ